MFKIICATPKDDYTLDIVLDNHHKIIYDMKPRLQAVRFCKLSALNVFKDVRVVNENTLIWNSFC